jgi:hypothetical protein
MADVAAGRQFLDTHHVTRWWMAIVLMGCGHVVSDPRLVDDGGAPADAADGRDGAPGDAPDAMPPAQGWALVQTKAVEGSTLNVDRVGAQHLVVVAVQLDVGGLVTALTDSSGCNTYTAIAAAHAGCADVTSGLQILFASNSCPGADAISAAATTKVLAMAAWEVAGIRTDAPVDKAVVVDNQVASGNPLGPSITTSEAGEFVVSVVIVANDTTGIHPGNAFTNDQTAFGNGWAHLTDPMAKAGSYQAQWDQSSAGVYCASAAAFKAAP